MIRPLRIAQGSPLYDRVPPTLYGGTERIVSYLTEELVRRGHQVTLFASGDSRTRAKLVAPAPRALRLDSASNDELAFHVLEMSQVFDHTRSSGGERDARPHGAGSVYPVRSTDESASVGPVIRILAEMKR